MLLELHRVCYFYGECVQVYSLEVELRHIASEEGVGFRGKILGSSCPGRVQVLVSAGIRSIAGSGFWVKGLRHGISVGLHGYLANQKQHPCRILQ